MIQDDKVWGLGRVQMRSVVIERGVTVPESSSGGMESGPNDIIGETVIKTEVKLSTV